MPGGHEGRAGTQVRFSDRLDWWCGRPQRRDDISTIPFVGEVCGETPRQCIEREVRRRDVGSQSYGHGVPTMNSGLTDRLGFAIKATSYDDFSTSHGKIRLSSNERDFGFMPTAASVLFLKHEYLGSRLPPPPQRYF